MFFKTNMFKLLLLCFALWLGLFYSTIVSTVAIWVRSETFTHSFLILPICIYLVREKWNTLLVTKIQPNYWLAIPLFGILLIWVFGALAQLLVIEQGAAFLFFPVFIWLVMGNKVARVLAFTLIFWMFSVPVGEFLIPQLQELTADITVYALQLTGIPVFRDGLYIAIPGGLFEVAVACSGIRYLIASLTLGTLYAYLNYVGLKKRLIFVVFAIFLPLLANGIRAYGIVMIAYLTEMEHATGVDHLVYGWFFFGIIIFIMFAIGNIWADVPQKQADASALNDAPLSSRAIYQPIVLGVALVLATIGYKQLMQAPVSDIVFDPANVFVGKPAEKEKDWQPVFINPTIEREGQHNNVDYYLAYYDESVHGKELINSVNKLYNFKSWTVVKNEAMGNYNVIEITNSTGIKRLLVYTYSTSWITSPAAAKIKITQAIQALLGIPQTGYVFVMSVILTGSSEQRETLLKEAEERMTPDLMGYLTDG